MPLFFGVEAEVFKQEHFAGFEIGGSFSSVGAIGSKLHVAAECLGHCVLDLGERVFGVDLAFGLAHVAHDDERAAVGEDLFEGGEGTADAGVVGDVAIFVEGHVEVNADDGFLYR